MAALSWACWPGLRGAKLKLLRTCTRAGAAGAKGEDSGDQGRERQVTCVWAEGGGDAEHQDWHQSTAVPCQSVARRGGTQLGPAQQKQDLGFQNNREEGRDRWAVRGSASRSSALGDSRKSPRP